MKSKREKLSFLVYNTHFLLQYFLIGIVIVLGIFYIILQNNHISGGYLLQQTAEKNQALVLKLEEVEQKIAVQKTQKKLTKNSLIQTEFVPISQKYFFKMESAEFSAAKNQ